MGEGVGVVGGGGTHAGDLYLVPLRYSQPMESSSCPASLGMWGQVLTHMEIIGHNRTVGISYTSNVMMSSLRAGNVFCINKSRSGWGGGERLFPFFDMSTKCSTTL